MGEARGWREFKEACLARLHHRYRDLMEITSLSGFDLVNSVRSTRMEGVCVWRVRCIGMEGVCVCGG